MDPEDSLIMRDEDLRTIPEKESDEVIKSSVENLIPIPSESEDTFDNDSECDLPFCDDSSRLDILGDNFVTFSNPLFDSNDDFTSRDDESFPDENVQKEIFKTYLNPLFEFDDKYISSDINPLFNEVLEYCGGPHANFQCQPRNQNFYEPNICYNSNSSGFDKPSQYSIDHQPQSIQEDLKELIKSHKDELFKTMQFVVEMFRQREQAANLSTHTPEPSQHFNSIFYDDDDDDDDDEESTIPLNEIISQIPPSIAITPILPTMEPEDSLVIGDEDLRTITKKESDEVIKSSVEDLVPIPSEFEETSDNDSECDLPFCDDSSPPDVLGVNSVTLSNPLFDSNDDFTSSDDESFPDEDVQEENFKTYSNPLFEFDDKYISSDVNPLFNEMLEDIESKDSYVSNLDEPALLVVPLSDANEDECLTQEAVLMRSMLFLDIDVSTDIKDGYHDLEGDVTYLECLLSNDTIPNLPPGVFFDHDPKSLNDEHDNDDLKSMIKVFNLGIHEKIISPTYVRLPFEDRHYFSLTFVIKIFLLFLTYLVNSLLLSSGNEDTIFDPSISSYSFCSLEPLAYESPMKIFPFFCFCPQGQWNSGIAWIMKTLMLVASEDVVNRKSSSCSVICYTSSHSPCILQQLCLQGVLTPVRGESSEILNGFDVSLLVAIISGVVSLCPSEGVCLVNETHFYSHYLNIGLVNPLAPREKCQPSNIGFAIRLLPKAIIL
ncbi:hypothetical protein Tco_0443352 [Tanacetum coccineum]